MCKNPETTLHLCRWAGRTDGNDSRVGPGTADTVLNPPHQPPHWFSLIFLHPLFCPHSPSTLTLCVLPL